MSYKNVIANFEAANEALSTQLHNLLRYYVTIISLAGSLPGTDESP